MRFGQGKYGKEESVRGGKIEEVNRRGSKNRKFLNLNMYVIYQPQLGQEKRKL